VNALLGTALTAAGAAVLNQHAERSYDALMRRTAKRPLPAGQVQPGLALLYGVALGGLGTAWLAIFVNLLTAGLGLGTLLLYVLVYTPLKRRTSLNTLVGAIPGAIPPMMGVTAFTNELTPAAWVLFAILFIWQMPHFYGLAMLCREDYARGGFVMLPTRPNGLARTGRQSVLFLALLLPVSLLPAVLGISGGYYAVAAGVLGVWFLMAGLESLRTLENAEARRLFLTSILYLPLLLVAMMLDKQ
jgi:protoheme IX farnesyltransferase